MNTFNIYFDGGSYGTNGYGSWEILFKGFSKKVSRKQFNPSNSGFKVTSNVAEYLTLEDALKWLQSVKEKKNYSVVIHGDSRLVMEQMVGRWLAKKQTMKQLRDNCRELLVGFGDWQCRWIPRIKNVSRFGH